ncbi:MAG: SusC/RagA family TonB-linked outer membrane protein, partial [Bacteroides xylanisolvens]
DNSEFLISARGQSPVAIVDGVERDLYSIDPEAIESVTIQKDALSNMFLGMRSSRGALIITTKNPDAKGGFHLSLTGKFGISSALKSGPNPLSAYQYAYLLNEALLNDGKSPLYTYDDFEAYRNGTSPYLHPDVNWKDAIMNNSTTSQAYNLNVTGGGRVAQYFVSLGYYSENGLFKTSDANSYNTNFKYNRYLITSKVNINVTDEFKVSMSLMGRIEEGNQPGGISGTGYSDLLSNVWQTPNNAYPVLNPNGTYGGNASYTQNLYAQTTGSGYISSNTRDVVGTINLKYDFDKLVRGLSVGATGNISSQVRNAIVRTKQAQVFQYSITQQGNDAYDKYGDVSPQTNSYRSVSTYQYMYGKMYVDWERQFGMHGVKASLWGDTRTILNNYDLPMIPSNIGQKVEYNYNNKYFAQAAVTESYYNRYDNGRRWGAFWAVGLGWDISKEKFMEASEIDQLKLRATYGHTGNGIDNAGYFSYLKRYNEDGGFWYSNGTSMSNGGSVSEISPLANTLLTWEKGRKVNVGLDLTLLKNRLTLSADYYNDYYYDILQSRGKSIQLLGIAYPSENIGKTRYYGLETQLSWQDHIGKVNYYVSANWSMEQNKRLFMDEQYVPYDYLKMTGQPTGAIYGLVATGFLTAKDIADGYPVMNGFNNIQAGDVKYKDMNGDGEINEFDRTVIGGDKPTCYFGIDLGFEWKGLEVTALIQGAYNRDLYNSDRTLLEGFQMIGQSYGQAYTNLLNRWTPETAETATYPRLTAGGNMYNYGNNWNSSLFVQNGNYIRLKNATVSYKLPENFCRNYLGGLRVKIFVQGQNLLTWSRTRLQDPEVTFTSYPLQRTITTGINLNF